VDASLSASPSIVPNPASNNASSPQAGANTRIAETTQPPPSHDSQTIDKFFQDGNNGDPANPLASNSPQPPHGSKTFIEQASQRIKATAPGPSRAVVSFQNASPLPPMHGDLSPSILSPRHLLAASIGLATRGLLGKTTFDADIFSDNNSQTSLADRFSSRRSDLFGQREIDPQSLNGADRAGLLEENGQRQVISSATAAAAARRRKSRRQPAPTPLRRSIACATTIVVGCLLQTIFLLHTTDAYAITLLCVATNICTLAIVGWSIGVKRWLPRRSPELLVLSVFAGLIAAAMTWNMLYHGYTRTLVYRNEIFRRALHRPYTPLYGAPQHFNARVAILCGIGGAALLAGASIFIFASRARRFAWSALIAAQLAAIVCFAISERPHRLAPDVSGYAEFSKDLPRFSSTTDLVQHYIEKMPTLSWLNQHYPPGNMLLFLMQKQAGLPYLVKSIVIFFGLLTSIPLYLLCRELELNKIASRCAVVLCACSSAVVIYTTVNTTSLILPLTALFALGMIRSMRVGSRRAALLAGISLVGFWTISFSFTLPAALLMLMSLIALYRELLNWRYVVRAWLWCGSCILGGLVFLRAVVGLDLVGCLIIGVQDHQLQQRNDPFHPWQSYLLRSTGNILAYLIVVAPLAAFAGMSLFKSARSNPQRTLAGTLGLATWITLLVAGFSGLFWLETERIWVFFTPFLAIAAAYAIARYDRSQNVSLPLSRGQFGINRMALATCILSAIALVSSYEMIFMPYRP
ncbi:MAG TPA: hypothetical protein VHS31_04530, partial [Tepidisphaeraceae bacterium]|nr:hypothetical protein [Tepidisphaeraceae bacterium]